MRVQHVNTHIGRYIKKKKAAGPRHTSGIRKKQRSGSAEKKLPQTGRQRNLDRGSIPSIQTMQAWVPWTRGRATEEKKRSRCAEREKKGGLPGPPSYRSHMCTLPVCCTHKKCECNMYIHTSEGYIEKKAAGPDIHRKSEKKKAGLSLREKNCHKLGGDGI